MELTSFKLFFYELSEMVREKPILPYSHLSSEIYWSTLLAVMFVEVQKQNDLIKMYSSSQIFDILKEFKFKS
jgi:hypothetical protein